MFEVMVDGFKADFCVFNGRRLSLDNRVYTGPRE